MRFFITLLVANALAIAAAAAESPVINIAVVRDGPSWYSDELTAMIDADLQELVGDNVRVHFDADAKFDADWKIGRVPAALQNALADSECRAVLVTGPLGLLFAGYGDTPFRKPVFGAAGTETGLLDLPADSSGRPVKSNFAFAADQRRVEKDLEAFCRLVPAKTIHVLIDMRIAANIPGIKDHMTDLAARLGRRFVGVAVTSKADDVMAVLLARQAEAVYVTPLLEMPQSERKKLFDALAAKKIPAFSLIGDEEVELGAFAGLNRGLRQRLAHQAAISLQRILQGASPNSLPVNLAPSESLVINARTAHAIGFSPDFDTRIDADFLHAECLDEGAPLSLENAMNLAGENNADIAVQQAVVERAREEHAVTRSQLLPQVSGSARYSQIDHDRAVDSSQGIAERETRAGVKLSQTIYDESALARREVARHGTKQSMYDEQRARFDAMNSAGANYLQLLLARSVLEIERNNLRLTRQHLALAQNRYRLGAAGQDEFLRWEASEAQQHGSVLAAESDIEKTRVAMNRAMGANADETWAPASISLTDTSFYFLDDAGLPAMITGEKRMAKFREFSVLKSIEGAPELKQLDEAIAAQHTVIAQKDRSFYVPQVSASAGYDRILDQNFAGTDFTAQLAAEGLPVSPLRHPDYEWQAGVVATLPIFESGARNHDLAAARAQLDQLEQTRVKISQQVEQRALNAVFSIQSSHPKIALARIAADRSRRSLQIVSDKYSRGATQIIDVFDAQNQAVRSETDAATAVTQFLADILEYQRSISWFEKFQSPEARAAWMNHFKRFIGENGGGAPAGN